MATVLQYNSRICLGEGLGIRPPLKWAGGKRWLVPHLNLIWAKYVNRRLVEPFCGGLAVALGLLPENALLNDINPHAINFYRWLKRGLNSKLEMRNNEESYYESRVRFNELITSRKATTKEAAELFYYLNRTGYNGLCRFNQQGGYNVPFGRYRNLNYSVFVGDFSAYKSIFADWQFTVGDFEQVAIAPDDFIYADPPYDVEFTQYAKEGFGWNDQVRLAEWLAKHPGPVVLSNQATKAVVRLYEDLDFKITLLDAPRMISCTGDRTRAKEVLATRGI